MSPKAICLVIVSGGVAEAVHPEHVECRIIDFDNIEAGDAPPVLPRDRGYETLVLQASLTESKDYTWEKLALAPFSVWEYLAPRDKIDPPRWITARSAESANKAARRRGWRPCSSKDWPIYGFRSAPQTPKTLRAMGCDLVLQS